MSEPPEGHPPVPGATSEHVNVRRLIDPAFRHANQQAETDALVHDALTRFGEEGSELPSSEEQKRSRRRADHRAFIYYLQSLNFADEDIQWHLRDSFPDFYPGDPNTTSVSPRVIRRQLTEKAENVTNIANKSNTRMTEARPGRPTAAESHFDYAAPDTYGELSALEELQSELAETVEAMLQMGVDSSEYHVAGLHEVASRYAELAKKVGLHAVSEGRLSQVKLSKAIGVSQLTVGRWVKDAKDRSAELK